ncbi:hypothetical protein SAMN02745132_02515 [Enterovibrio nigricans DSM 22720]|uniref:Uncharacterized protein n=1 Tax=Enterovibrio nigricans DSM 22720 TaxID=1121868 RepID=A0A1T4UTR6_9GAMM|nr:hypothetical protein SAMN02745132_02515 [Enterovibrio nigricans DSM 22720]
MDTAIIPMGYDETAEIDILLGTGGMMRGVLLYPNEVSAA